MNGIWFWPSVIGVLSAVGLLSALFYDGWGDWLSWLTLLPPIALSIWYGWLQPADRASGSARGRS